MPAWITSELRELVCVPKASSASRTTTSRPAAARARATARPTTPAPSTTASSFSTSREPVEEESARAGERGDARHRPRAAVEGRAERGTHERAAVDADRADERGHRARGRGEGRHRGGGGIGHDERGTEQEQDEGRDDRDPVRGADPGEQRGRRARY